MLTEKKIPHDVKTYPHTGHSFADRAPLHAVSRIIGFGENKDAAAAFEGEIREFVRKDLAPFRRARMPGTPSSQDLPVDSVNQFRVFAANVTTNLQYPNTVDGIAA